MALALALLAACAADQSANRRAGLEPPEGRTLIARAIPRSVRDRAGWTSDIDAAFTALSLAETAENGCAVAAVIEQESSFSVDPVVPGLASIAWREIDERAQRAGVPRVLVHGVLEIRSADGRSFGERIDHARTEKELSDVYEDLIAAVPMGRTLFADRNPIRTRGPMQVHVHFAEQFAGSHHYPYPVQQSIADEVFTRRGGVYFGVAHLLAYQAPYDRFLYRFADFNAGQYASRNAAFQRALGAATGMAVVSDGALLPPDAGSDQIGNTERALRRLAARLEQSDDALHRALASGKTQEFESTAVYRRVFALADAAEHRPLPRAVVPTIELRGPKISRALTTSWYANRVNERFERCLAGR